jgi:hypothetical protein
LLGFGVGGRAGTIEETLGVTVTAENGTLFMPDLFSNPPHILLILGFALLFAAVVSVCTGKTFYRGSVYRAKDPSEFWWLVAIYFLGGVLFIETFLYAS